MRKNEEFTVDMISQIDDDIVTENLMKRFTLWSNRAQKKPNRWIPIVAIAAVFALIISSVFLFMPDNSSTDKQVPIYQGMTVSNEAPVVEMATHSSFSMPLFGAIGMRFGTSGMPNTNKETPETSAPEISGGPYYAQPNEDIYIHVHISNPDEFEILSFTLNGVKYSAYMFETGSNLETLILKYNVGDKEGVQQYTIDAIKYVDGEDIKDVRMEGNRTIEVLVGNDAEALAFETKFEGWELVIEPKWTDSFTGEKTILTLGIYDGETLLRELDSSDRTISNLPMDKRLLLVATYLDEGETITVTIVIQTPKQSEGLLVVNGVVTGLGTCTDTELYINMPIGEMAFMENKHISKIYFGNQVSTIGENAFLGCTKLTDITFSDGIDTIGISAFASCYALRNVILPPTLTNIEEAAFAHCNALAEITLPENLTSLGIGAFWGSQSLQKVNIKSSSVQIKPSRTGTHVFDPETGDFRPKPLGTTFEDCPSLSSVYFSGTVTEWNTATSELKGWYGIKRDITVHCTNGEVIIPKS